MDSVKGFRILQFKHTLDEVLGQTMLSADVFKLRQQRLLRPISSGQCDAMHLLCSSLCDVLCFIRTGGELLQVPLLDVDHLLQVALVEQLSLFLLLCRFGLALDDFAFVQLERYRVVSFILELKTFNFFIQNSWSPDLLVLVQNDIDLHEFPGVDVSGLDEAGLDGHDPEVAQSLQVKSVVVWICREDRIESTHQSCHREGSPAESEGS